MLNNLYTLFFSHAHLSIIISRTLSAKSVSVCEKWNIVKWKLILITIIIDFFISLIHRNKGRIFQDCIKIMFAYSLWILYVVICFATVVHLIFFKKNYKKKAADLMMFTFNTIRCINNEIIILLQLHKKKSLSSTSEE